MPMRYANQDDVLSQIQRDNTSPDLGRITRLENGVADAIDELIGRTFGTPTPRTVTVQTSCWLQVVMLPELVRSVTAVTVDGVAPAMFMLMYRIEDGYRGIHFPRPIFGEVAVTGVWESDPLDGPVPDLIREAATAITVDEFRVRNASPSGEIGMDGMVVPVRNIWRYTLVKQAIKRYRTYRPRVAV